MRSSRLAIDLIASLALGAGMIWLGGFLLFTDFHPLAGIDYLFAGGAKVMGIFLVLMGALPFGLIIHDFVKPAGKP